MCYRCNSTDCPADGMNPQEKEAVHAAVCTMWFQREHVRASFLTPHLSKIVSSLNFTFMLKKCNCAASNPVTQQYNISD